MPRKAGKARRPSAAAAGVDVPMGAAAGGEAEPLEEMGREHLPFASVVKIFVTLSKPNYVMPWQMRRQESCTGSGFVISGKRILTNAHVVADESTVRVRRHGGLDKFVAAVQCINHACDLAILSIAEDGFWDGLQSLSISSELPELYHNVMVIGYPMGGDNICVTRGVVSRITTLAYEDQKYFVNSPQLLAIQIDAAINSGNSGGPVVHESGYVVGVAFSGFAGSADNIGYIIPYPVITNFLDDYERVRESPGICNFGFSYMLCENPSLRASYQLKPPDSGILVVKTAPLGAAAKAGLKKDDVVLAIGGCKVSNDGTIDFRRDERLSVQHKVSNHPLGKKCRLDILRDGHKKTLRLDGALSPELVPQHRKPRQMPSFLIVGGVIFTPLTCGLLDSAVESLSEEAWQAGREAKKHLDEQVIVIISIMSHKINHGYGIHRLPLLTKFNGKKVRNLGQLKRKVDKVATGFLNFTLGNGKSIILDAQQCREASTEILETYAIPSAFSRDLVSDAAAAAAADDDEEEEKEGDSASEGGDDDDESGGGGGLGSKQGSKRTPKAGASRGSRKRRRTPKSSAR